MNLILIDYGLLSKKTKNTFEVKSTESRDTKVILRAIGKKYAKNDDISSNIYIIPQFKINVVVIQCHVGQRGY